MAHTATVEIINVNGVVVNSVSRRCTCSASDDHTTQTRSLAPTPKSKPSGKKE